MDEGEDEGEAHAVHKPERMYKLLSTISYEIATSSWKCLFAINYPAIVYKLIF